MTIDPATGLVLWSPQLADVGPQNVTVEVDDGFGGTATQSYTLVVSADASFPPPSITSTPSSPATVGLKYTYNVTAIDPSGLNPTFSLPTAPAGMTIDPSSGVLTWTPAGNQVGSQSVAVEAADPSGAAAVQTFTLPVLAADRARRSHRPPSPRSRQALCTGTT